MESPTSARTSPIRPHPLLSRRCPLRDLEKEVHSLPPSAWFDWQLPSSAAIACNGRRLGTSQNSLGTKSHTNSDVPIRSIGHQSPQLSSLSSLPNPPFSSIPYIRFNRTSEPLSSTGTRPCIILSDDLLSPHLGPLGQGR